ncbi:ubiquitin-like protein ATG12 [Pelomyxa schiedti]|nr:ubiquitin-like protein ATG12 [Pelomyxa schiedti]
MGGGGNSERARGRARSGAAEAGGRLSRSRSRRGRRGPGGRTGLRTGLGPGLAADEEFDERKKPLTSDGDQLEVVDDCFVSRVSSTRGSALAELHHLGFDPKKLVAVMPLGDLKRLKKLVRHNDDHNNGGKGRRRSVGLGVAGAPAAAPRAPPLRPRSLARGDVPKASGGAVPAPQGGVQGTGGALPQVAHGAAGRGGGWQRIVRCLAADDQEEQEVRNQGPVVEYLILAREAGGAKAPHLLSSITQLVVDSEEDNMENFKSLRAAVLLIEKFQAMIPEENKMELLCPEALTAILSNAPSLVRAVPLELNSSEPDPSRPECRTGVYSQLSFLSSSIMTSAPITTSASTLSTSKPTAPADPHEQVLLRLESTPGTPGLKKKEFKLRTNAPISTVTDWLRKQLQVPPESPVYIFLNSAFQPCADELVGDLFKCFQLNGKLIVHYGIKEVWG